MTFQNKTKNSSTRSTTATPGHSTSPQAPFNRCFFACQWKPLALNLIPFRYLSPTRTAICLLPHGDMMPEWNTLVTLANRRFTQTRKLIICIRPRCSWALQTSSSTGRIGRKHHFPGRLVFIVRQFGAPGCSEGLVRVERDEGNNYVYKIESAAERLVKCHTETRSDLYLR